MKQLWQNSTDSLVSYQFKYNFNFTISLSFSPKAMTQWWIFLTMLSLKDKPPLISSSGTRALVCGEIWTSIAWPTSKASTLPPLSLSSGTAPTPTARAPSYTSLNKKPLSATSGLKAFWTTLAASQPLWTGAQLSSGIFLMRGPPCSGSPSWRGSTPVMWSWGGRRGPLLLHGWTLLTRDGGSITPCLRKWGYKITANKYYGPHVWSCAWHSEVINILPEEFMASVAITMCNIFSFWQYDCRESGEPGTGGEYMTQVTHIYK